jgi:hypothetical protein
MLWLVAACVFIDDAEHAAFVATLASGGDTQDPVDTAEPDDTGGGGGSGPWAAPVADVAAGFTLGGARDGFGTAVAVGESRLLVSTDGRAVGDEAWMFAPSLGAIGRVTVLEATDATTTDARTANTLAALAVPTVGGAERITAGLPVGSRVLS